MDPVPERSCGACSLCCTVLRVDELGKPGGAPCPQLRSEGGCSIYAERPRICRAYRCLWLRGSLREQDRPDRLGALLDLVERGGRPYLEIREAAAGAFRRSERLREIAAAYRETIPVCVMDAIAAPDSEPPLRILLPQGEEHRLTGDAIAVYRGGELVEQRRMPWLQRGLRHLNQWRLRRRLSRFRGPAGAPF